MDMMTKKLKYWPLVTLARLTILSLSVNVKTVKIIR